MIFCWSILVFTPEPVLPDEIDEQSPQHQVDDDEWDGEPQGRIEDVIVEIHITCGSIFSLQIYAGRGQSAVLIRILMSQFAISPVLIRKIRQLFNSH